MPLAHLLPRSRPSMQTMRPVDGSHVSPTEDSVQNLSNRTYEISERSGSVQPYHWISSRRPSTPKAIASFKEQSNGAPPLPDFLQRVVHSPGQLRSVTSVNCLSHRLTYAFVVKVMAVTQAMGMHVILPAICHRSPLHHQMIPMRLMQHPWSFPHCRPNRLWSSRTKCDRYQVISLGLSIS